MKTDPRRALRAPRGRFQIDADDPPVGAWELEALEPDALLPSLRVADHAGAELWQNLAERLPADHPITLACTAFEDRGGR